MRKSLIIINLFISQIFGVSTFSSMQNQTLVDSNNEKTKREKQIEKYQKNIDQLKQQILELDDFLKEGEEANFDCNIYKFKYQASICSFQKNIYLLQYSLKKNWTLEQIENLINILQAQLDNLKQELKLKQWINTENLKQMYFSSTDLNSLKNTILQVKKELQVYKEKKEKYSNVS